MKSLGMKLVRTPASTPMAICRSPVILNDWTACAAGQIIAVHMALIRRKYPPQKLRHMWPLFYTGDILAGFYTAEDGRTNPG